MSTRESVDAGGSPNARGRKLSGVTTRPTKQPGDLCAINNGGMVDSPATDPPRYTADAWNKVHKVGILVRVTLDTGALWFTRTRSEAWTLGHGQPVVMLVGKSGGYDLSRVQCAACAGMNWE